MNSVTTGGLSQPIAWWKCNVSKDADYPHQDGKTPGALLQLVIGLRVLLRSVVGRIWRFGFGRTGSANETPICKICNSNWWNPFSLWTCRRGRKRDVKFPSKIGVFCVPENYSQAKRVSSRQWLVGSFAGAAASSAVCYCRKGRSRSNARRKFSCMLGKLFLKWMQGLKYLYRRSFLSVL